MTTPTTHQFTKYQWLYDYYNKELFADKLPFCLLILSRSTARVCGHFSKDRWHDKQGNKTHEINLNPVYMAAATDIDICQTLVHEMVHLWQYEFGKPSRPGYHNREWANKMEAIGLMPSHTGEPGGRKVGQRMSDYPIKGGKFEKAFQKMPKDLLLPFTSAEFISQPIGLLGEMMPAITIGDGETLQPVIPTKPKNRTRTKYSCRTCKTNVWGKPELELICKPCLSHYLVHHDEIDSDILERFMLQVA